MSNEDDGNVTHEMIGIPTPDGVKNIHPDAFKQYRQDAFEYLDAETAAKGNFKDLMETIEEVTEIPKGIMSKYLKAKYKAKTKEAKELGDAFEALDSVIPEPKSCSNG